MERKERLIQLERERDHFYSKQADYNDLRARVTQDKNGKQFFNETSLSAKLRKGQRTPSDSGIPRTDAFDKLVRKDLKARQNYTLSDKVLLQNERDMNVELESSYSKLLLQVEQLQTTHQKDLRNNEGRFHTTSSALQKALVSKSEALLAVTKRLSDSEEKFTRERAELLGQNERLLKNSKDQFEKQIESEAKLNEMTGFRKELVQRVSAREQELIKYSKALRERQSEFSIEKEKRMSGEAKLLNFAQELEKAQIEVAALKKQLIKRESEAVEFGRLAAANNDMAKDLEDISRREKHYKVEIEQITTRERKLHSQGEEAASKGRKNNEEILNLKSEIGRLNRENKDYSSLHERAHGEMQLLVERTDKQAAEIQKYQTQTYTYQQDTSRLIQEFNSLKGKCNTLQSINQGLTSELDMSKERELLTSKDIISSHTQLVTLTKNLTKKQRENSEMITEITTLNEKLEREMSEKKEFRSESQEQFDAVSVKINDLQNTLLETQTQLLDLRSNEKTVRASLRQRDESLKKQTSNLAAAESKIKELLKNGSTETIEFEQFRMKKKDEIESLKDKLKASKQSKDADIVLLRSQLEKKDLQSSSISEELNQVRTELRGHNQNKAAMESRLSVMVAGETSLQKQINALVKQRSMDLDSAKKDKAGKESSIQLNLDEISKRLKAQVEHLLEQK